MKHNRLALMLVFATVLCSGAHVKAQDQIIQPDEEKDVRAVLARFYDGWNAHDADKMRPRTQKILTTSTSSASAKGRDTLRQTRASIRAAP